MTISRVRVAESDGAGTESADGQATVPDVSGYEDVTEDGAPMSAAGTAEEYQPEHDSIAGKLVSGL